ncbi:glycine-rich domain-containing protein [Corynebacterium variabile]|uniref:glycine-rich domain-containing protein n=1 Tax=Corynebacterium variabile TaxID=1727 RepID=UPI00406A8FC7
MPLRVGTSTGSTVPKDIRVGATLVKSVRVGTATGAVELWRRADDTLAAFTVVTADTTVIVPAWAGYVDAVAIGGGGGGHGGFAVISQRGRGGAAGQWANTSGIVSPGASLTVSIGVGGAAETDGGSTTITAAGTALVSAGGGANSGMSNYVGGTPAPYTAFGFTFTGGSGGGVDTAGGAPGGGGGGGSGDVVSLRPGQPGGRGQVWLRFRSY